MPPNRSSHPPRSATKEEFLASINLNNVDHSHKQLYRRMLDEAGAGRERLSSDPNNLYSSNRSDPKIQPPYSADNMTETAMHREVMNIWTLASPETRRYYNFGGIQNAANTDNWVIRWCLWHAFRYRDNRNGKKSGPSQEPRDVYGQTLGLGGQQGGVYWDPIRN